MDSFYKKFEDRFRGSRELITERLKVYLPLIEPLKTLYPDSGAIDLGCGRGEWLELLKANGHQAHGIDSDEGMLEEATKHGLSVEQGDAIQYLKSLPSDSISLVTGFHIAEHLPFPILQELVQEALRALKPAGLLILETPNPENITVGSNSFYIDPTHVRPIPPPLLSFLPEFYGFERVTVFRLNSLDDAFKEASLFNVISGASPDYSVIAQKSAEPDALKLFDAEFGKKHGVAFEELAQNYEQDNSFRQELENLMRLLAEREHAQYSQLQDAQQQSHMVEQEWIRREQALSSLVRQQIEKSRHDSQVLLRDMVKRERDLADRLALMQTKTQQILEEKDIAHDKHEQELQEHIRSLQSALDLARSEASEQGRVLREGAQKDLDAARAETQAYMQRLIEREAAFNEELARVHGEKLKMSEDLLRAHEEFERKLEEAGVALQTQMQRFMDCKQEYQDEQNQMAKIAAEQVHDLTAKLTNQADQYALVAAELAEVKRSLTWRLTSPIRMLLTWIIGKSARR
jgi:O-antigen chain-terminating methyltransferase